MVRALLIRGMLAGLVAALVAVVVAMVIGEPAIESAIALEESAAGHGAAHDEEAAPVSRAVQSTLGLGVGTIMYGVAVGGLFALAFAVVLGRVGRVGPRATAAVLAGGAYVSVVLVPFLKYPANPPAVGDPETIEQRSVLYLAVLLSSVALLALAVHLRGRLVGRLGGWNATLAACAGYLVAMVLVTLTLPVITEVPADFPAALLWRFRIASLGIQLALWATLGLVFGALAARALGTSRAGEQRAGIA
jgi:predicted cobalt transporter CbtA